MEKIFPDNMRPLGNQSFRFSCHPGVSCFNVCCKKVDMLLFPYDVLLLKNTLKITSAEFLQKYTRIVQGENPYFPSLMLKLDENQDCCPFLGEEGCTVYRDRPSACRTYPLERAVDRNPAPGDEREFYFLKKHDYCKGHLEQSEFTVKTWIRNQRVEYFNLMNDLWAEMDTLFAGNPWKGEGAGGNKQRMAFMVCYDIDGFREFLQTHELLKQYRVSKELRRRIEDDDVELMKFGFDWLKLIFGAKSSL